MTAVLILALVAVIVVLGLVLWSVRRHRDPDIKVDCDLPIDQVAGSLAGLTLGTALPGNTVEVLQNGAFFDALLASIAEARHSVHFETFLWKEGVLGKRLADALAERARAGVRVRVLLDAHGCQEVGKGDTAGRMRDAGCRVEFFHEKRLRHIGMINDRNHRKLAVVDGREAFVGGHCVVDSWLGNAENKEHFADVSVRLRGPAVNSVQSAFSENWTGHTGELFVGDEVFPTLLAAGESLVHAAFVKPEGSAPAVKILHHTAICLARTRIWIQNPYFIPDPAAIVAFAQAVARGVDVRVLMPSTGGSDMPMVQHAGHRNFERLLACGVRLFEYSPTLLHQKIMTVDGVWSAIGSSNFDDRSFETNDEITLAITDARVASELDGIFEKYAAGSQEIRIEAWRQRGLWHRFKDNAYYLINEFL
jgi:cardiolipin synthase A/B